MDNAIRLYFDENVDLEVARQIRERGVEVVTARDLGLLGDTDENHLNRAVQMGYVLCTHDTDFLRLAATGFEHNGIIIFVGRPNIGDWVRGLELICGAMTAEEMKNHIEYLP